MAAMISGSSSTLSPSTSSDELQGTPAHSVHSGVLASFPSIVHTDWLLREHGVLWHLWLESSCFEPQEIPYCLQSNSMHPKVMMYKWFLAWIFISKSRKNVLFWQFEWTAQNHKWNMYVSTWFHVLFCRSVLSVNLPRQSDTYRCHWTGSSLVMVTACCLFDAKPLVTWTNADLLSVGPLRTNPMKRYNFRFSCKKMV